MYHFNNYQPTKYIEFEENFYSQPRSSTQSSCTFLYQNKQTHYSNRIGEYQMFDPRSVCNYNKSVSNFGNIMENQKTANQNRQNTNVPSNDINPEFYLNPKFYLNGNLSNNNLSNNNPRYNF